MEGDGLLGAMCLVEHSLKLEQYQVKYVVHHLFVGLIHPSYQI